MERAFGIYHRKINYYETDQMGVVHHSNYIRFFEEARLELMTAVGLDYAAMEKQGIIIPVTFAECKYVSPLRFGDAVRIESVFTKFDGIKMEVSYEIFKKGEEKASTTGKTGHCFLDRELKPIRMKRKYPEIYNRLKELVQS